MKKLMILLLMSISLSSQAMDTVGYYKIINLSTWGGGANGAVLVRLENVNASCPNGYWFQDSANAGPKNLMSMVLAAYYAKAPIRIYADENSDWTGLASKECEIQLISAGN